MLKKTAITRKRIPNQNGSKGQKDCSLVSTVHMVLNRRVTGQTLILAYLAEQMGAIQLPYPARGSEGLESVLITS